MKKPSSFNLLLQEIGDQVQFIGNFTRNIFKNGFEWNEFIRQCYLIGYKSVGIVVLTGFILGFVLTLQSLPTLKEFGAQNYVPSMVSISVIREIGPVIIGLICYIHTPQLSTNAGCYLAGTDKSNDNRTYFAYYRD